MIKLLQYLIINGLAVLLGATLLAGVVLDGYVTALVVAVVFGILNTVLKPILKILTLPITILTLGLFLLVINVAMVYLTTALVPGFEVAGWWSALFFSLIVSVSSGFLNAVSSR